MTHPAGPIRAFGGSVPFVVVKLHAAGGLGQVSLAFDPSLNRTVAIKEVRPEFADRPWVRGRFVDEAETAAALDHSGIVPVYAIGHDDNGRPYYAIKFVEGQTLEQAVNEYHRRPSPVQFNRLLRHFLDACHAVAYAHDRDVLHRDLKPTNVMIGKYGETLILDWGLARRIASPARRDSDCSFRTSRSLPSTAIRTGGSGVPRGSMWPGIRCSRRDR